MDDPLEHSAAVSPNRVVAFTLDNVRYALPLYSVEQVTRSVEITPLPDAPDVILGVINVRGRIVPVGDIRRRFRLAARDIGLHDKLVIARTTRRTLAVVADEVEGVFEYPGEHIVHPQEIGAGTDYIRAIAKSDGGLTLIHDLDTFLAPEDEQSLQRAMDHA